jgi:predicted nucleotidyltransferase
MAAVDPLKSRREAILQIARRHGVGRIRVFGSYARGDAGEGSDLDLLIDIEGPTTPWFPGGLVAELEALLGCRVDVVELEALRAEIRAQALAEAVPL